MQVNQKVPRKYQDFLKMKDRFNILGQEDAVGTGSPLYRVVPQIVRIDPDTSAGEVWKVKEGFSHSIDGEAFCLSKTGLLKIAHAAGITFDPRYTKRTDNATNPRRVEFQAAGSLQKPDGRWVTVTYSKEIDLDAIEKEIRMVLTQEALKGNQTTITPAGVDSDLPISQQVARMMLKWEKNKVAFADTGASLRVLRALLNLRSFYRSDELAKPFVVPRVCLNVRYILKDQDLRRWALREGIGAVLNVFGPPKL